MMLSQGPPAPAGPSSDSGPTGPAVPRRGLFASNPRLWIFVAWLGLFYLAWSGLLTGRHEWNQLPRHWPIAVAMALGSYIAGSTPMGGGTVGFPVLVLFFAMPAALGRNFSCMVQSIGMVSASILILCLKRPLAGRLLLWSMLGVCVGLPLGAVLVVPRVPGHEVTLLFAVIWCSFGILHFRHIREITGAEGTGGRGPRRDLVEGLAVGLVGGVVASLTGVGIDLLVYTVLVARRADIKSAVPTSVVLMAFTSVVGVVTFHALGSIQTEAYYNWLAAAPIVIIGAPFGAIVVEYLSRTRTLLIVSGLCILQYVWTCFDQKVVGGPLVASLLGVAAFNLVFTSIYRRTALAGTPAAAGVSAADGIYAVATHDEDTGLWSRQAFLDQVAMGLAGVKRFRRPLSVLSLELGDYQQLVRSNGHPAAAAAVRRLGEVVGREVREVDVLARLGPGVVGVLLTETDGAGATQLGQRLLARLREDVGQLADRSIVLQISTAAGAAPVGDTEPDDEVARGEEADGGLLDAAALLARADVVLAL